MTLFARVFHIFATLQSSDPVRDTNDFNASFPPRGKNRSLVSPVASMLAPASIRISPQPQPVTLVLNLNPPHVLTLELNVIDPNHASQLDPYFSSPRLEELGGSHVLCGLARLIMCVAEVPFFYLSGPLIRRLGVRGVIGLTQLAYLTRFIYYAVRLM